MSHRLMVAYMRASDIVENIGHFYDRAGLTCYQVMMDKSFLALQANDDHQFLWRHTARACNFGTSKIQASLSTYLSENGPSGNVAPKPDIKPGLFKAARVATEFLLHYGGRMQWTSPAVLTLAFGTVAAVIYNESTGGVHGLPEMIGTALGSDPRSSLGKPEGLKPSAQPSVS